MIPFGLEALMTLSLPIARRTTKCFVPGATAIYLFNEGSGQVLTDYSGNGNHGTLGATTSAPTWTQYGLSFDGNDRVALADVGALLAGGATFQVVVRPGADVTTGQGLVYAGFKKAGGLQILSGKVLLFAPGDTAGQYLYSTNGAVAANTWIDIAGTIAWSGAVAVYKDGAPNAAGTTTGTWTTPGATLNRIGVRDTSDLPLTGDVAAVLIYPFALTAAQVAQNHAALKGMLAARGIALA